MADLIDRQTAIEELAVYIHLIDKTMGKGTLTDDDCMEAAKSVLGEDELPTVHPDHNADIGKKVSISCSRENDLISRQATIDLVGDWIYNPKDLRYHKDVINSIPAAQPEIVRCKDCKHWDTEWSVSESGAHYCPMVDGNRNSDFYCADAERRTDG